MAFDIISLLIGIGIGLFLVIFVRAMDDIFN